MSVLHVAVQLAMLLAAGAGAQQRGASGGAEPVQVQVFAPGPDVTAPELLPFDAPLNPPESCEQEVDGKVKLSLLVDAAGRPRNIMFLRPLANDLDRFALQIAEADRFTPGTHSGSPVAVEVSLEVEGVVTQRSVLNALEARYPMLCGTMRDHLTQKRRPFIRFFACQEDLSHESPDAPLPDAVAHGTEPFLVIGAIAGG